MSFTLLFFLLAQAGFESVGNLKLDAAGLTLEKLTATPSGLYVCDMNGSTIYQFDEAGKLLRKLENSENKFPFPYQASWNPLDQQVIVYDGGSRAFALWDGQGAFVKNVKTSLDPAYEVGRLISIKDGYIAPVSLTEKKFLLAKFDKNFKQTKFNLELPLPILAGVGVEQRRSFAARVEVGGFTQVIAAQSLNLKLKLFDGDLNEVKELSIAPSGWKAPPVKKLLEVAKNPKEAEKLKSSYSEIIALEPVSGSLFVVGLRNIGATTYTYLVLDAVSGQQVGKPFDSDLLLLSAFERKFYMIPPDGKSTTLSLFRLK